MRCGRRQEPNRKPATRYPLPDACGRVIRRTEQKRGFRPQEWRYRWDDFDRLREVRMPDGDVWQYSYDAFGRRTAKRSVMRAAWKNQQHTVSEVHYRWQGMALSASEKRYADGSGSGCANMALPGQFWFPVSCCCQ